MQFVFSLKRCFLHIITVLTALLGPLAVFAQTAGNGSIVEYTVVGKDTIPSIGYDEFVVKGKRELTGKKLTEYFELNERVKRAYPIAKTAGETYKKALEEIKDLPEKEAKERMKKLEKELWETYTPVIKKMSPKTARILVKLIDRETGKSSFEMVKDLRGKGTASVYQIGTSLFGVSLKTEYNPDANEQDRIIEELIDKMEKGIQ